MSGFVEFAILGLGAGAVYVLLAQGVVIVYKGSGVVNFSQGAIGMFGAFLFYETRDNSHWPTPFAALFSVGLMAIFGALFSQLVIRRLQSRSRLAQIVSTLALLVMLQTGAQEIWGSNEQVVTSPLPHNPTQLAGITFPQDRLWLTGIAIVLTVLLAIVFRYTLIGHGVVSMAENPMAAATLGWSPDLLSGLTWGIGSGFAAIAGILVAPLVGLDTTTLTLVVIDALAVVLAAGFSSFLVVLIVGLALGIVESEAAHYVSTPGIGTAVALVIVVVVLVLRGQDLPVRGHILERLPQVGPGRINLRKVVIATLLAIVAERFVFPVSWVDGMIMSVTIGITLLSVIVLTGYAGQLSLAQYTLGGIGAVIAGQLVEHFHLPFELAILAGTAGCVLTGLFFALPALRTRGMNLAIITLALALATESIVFDGNTQITVGPQRFFGISVDPVFNASSYAILCTLFFAALGLGVANLRRSAAGRRLIAIRSNERAAAALGIGVVGGKLYAFAVAAGIAGIGGILAGFTSYVVEPSGFSTVQSITTIVYAMLGGVGFVIGAPLGAQLAPGGIGASITNAIPGLSFVANNIGFFGGLALILLLLQNPDGLASHISHRAGPGPIVRWMRGRVRLLVSRVRPVREAKIPRAVEVAEMDRTRLSPGLGAIQRVQPKVLEIREIVVEYGLTRAVDGVSFKVRSGEVVGLIGPNGAGKTTLLDAVSGFVRPVRGDVTLDSANITRWPVHRRARAGLGRSFQALELFEDISLQENMLAGCDDRGLWAYLTGLFGPRHNALTPAAMLALQHFGLLQDLETTPNNMSNGQRHLVAIARAVGSAPSLLLLDEPGAGLDDHETTELRRLIRTLAADWNIGVLVVEHNMDFVMSACDRIVVLDFGRVIADGTPDEVRADPAVVAAYLGAAEVLAVTLPEARRLAFGNGD